MVKIILLVMSIVLFDPATDKIIGQENFVATAPGGATFTEESCRKTLNEELARYDELVKEHPGMSVHLDCIEVQANPAKGSI